MSENVVDLHATCRASLWKLEAERDYWKSLYDNERAMRIESNEFVADLRRQLAVIR